MAGRKRLPVSKAVAKPQKKTVGLCGECASVVPVTTFHTLTVYGRNPTLGRCPYVKNRCVLLSETGCDRFVAKESITNNI